MNLLYIKSPPCFRSYFLCFLLFLTYSPVALSNECHDIFKWNQSAYKLAKLFSDLKPNNPRASYLGNPRIGQRTQLLKEIVKKGEFDEVFPWLREIITDPRDSIKIRKTAVDEYVSALKNYEDAFDRQATSNKPQDTISRALGHPQNVLAKLSISVNTLINERKDRGLQVLRYIGETLARLRHTDADINSLKELINQFEQSKRNTVQEHRKKEKENPSADSIPKSGAQKGSLYEERSKLLNQIVQNTELETYFPYFMKVTLDETESVSIRLFVLQKLFEMPVTPLLTSIKKVFRDTLKQRSEVLISNTGAEVLPKDHPNYILLDFINSHTNNVTYKQQLPPR